MATALGTPAPATRGFEAEEFRAAADVLATALGPVSERERDELASRVQALAARPLYGGLEPLHGAAGNGSAAEFPLLQGVALDSDWTD